MAPKDTLKVKFVLKATCLLALLSIVVSIGAIQYSNYSVSSLIDPVKKVKTEMVELKGSIVDIHAVKTEADHTAVKEDKLETVVTKVQNNLDEVASNVQGLDKRVTALESMKKPALVKKHYVKKKVNSTTENYTYSCKLIFFTCIY